MHDCPCCGEAVYTDDAADMCSCCVAADCPERGDECQIPTCLTCDTRATFCTDGKWHPNCDDPEACAREAIACWKPGCYLAVNASGLCDVHGEPKDEDDHGHT